jgi:hypothetical protein
VRRLVEVRKKLAPLIFKTDALSEQVIERLLPLNELLNIIVDAVATEEGILPYIAKAMGIKTIYLLSNKLSPLVVVLRMLS